MLVIDQALASELQTLLTLSGEYQGSVREEYDEPTRQAMHAFTGRENLEERWVEDARLDRVVLSSCARGSVASASGERASGEYNRLTCRVAVPGP